MMKLALMLVLAAAAQTPATNGVARPQQNFINVEGPDLRSRLAAALKLGSAQQRRFWVAYTFAVKPGVAFDTMFIGSGGSSFVINGRAVSSQLETRNLGVFLLYEGAGSTMVRAEIYNLERTRDYAGHPVYWLGRGPGDESLPLLRGLLDNVQSNESLGRLVDAIGAHDDPRGAGTLRDVIRSAKSERARTTAVSWLGHLPEQTEFLASLARDERERPAVREEAIDALGEMNNERAVDALAQLYDTARDERTKSEILDALGESDIPRALQKLMTVVQRDSSIKLRKRAIELLGESDEPAALKFLEQLIR